MNILKNIFKTAGTTGQQPWKAYYKGIKPKNPLGEKVVRRMGNKVKSVVPSTINKTMTFSYIAKPVRFSYDPYYTPPYKPLQPYYNKSLNSQVLNTPYLKKQVYSIPETESQTKYKRKIQEDARNQRREVRQKVADVRANYRTLLDTTREARGWTTTLGLV